MSPDDEMMDTREVSAFTRTPEETLRYWRKVRKGPPYFILGRRVLYTRTDVLAWLQAHRVDPAAETRGRSGRSAIPA